MRSLGVEVASPVPVRVEIGNRVLLQLSGMGFRPLRRAKQGWFFSIPEAIKDRTLGLPSLLQQFSEGARLFQFGAGSGDGISAPLTHASWWLPRRTHWSGYLEPGMRATTS